MYNQKSDLLSVDTTIVKSEDKGSQVLVTDSNNNYYSFFKTKQDGSPTAAATSFSLAQGGLPVSIVYKEVPYKDKTLRSVVKFRTPEAGRPSPSQPPYQAQRPSSPNVSRDSQGSQGSLGARLQLEGKVNGLLAAGVKPQEITLEVLGQCQALEARIVTTLIQTPESTQAINVEDISF